MSKIPNGGGMITMLIEKSGRISKAARFNSLSGFESLDGWRGLAIAVAPGLFEHKSFDADYYCTVLIAHQHSVRVSRTLYRQDELEALLNEYIVEPDAGLIDRICNYAFGVIPDCSSSIEAVFGELQKRWLPDTVTIDGKEHPCRIESLKAGGVEWGPGALDLIKSLERNDSLNLMPDGLKYDSGKPRFELLPPRALEGVASVLSFGALKYDADNWRKVKDANTRYIGAAMRHINAHMRGELLDPESRESHLSHAICSLMFVSELQEESK